MSRRVVKASVLFVGLCVGVSAYGLPPDANDDTLTGDEDTTLTGNVLANDSGDTFSVTLFSVDTPPEGGMIAFDGAGNVSYTPPAEFSGRVEADYIIKEEDSPTCDAAVPPGPCFDTGRIRYEVNPVADAPVLTNPGATGDEDTAINLNLSVVQVDGDGSQTETAIFSGVPAGADLSGATDLGGGTWSVDASLLNTVAYTPPADANGAVVLNLRFDILDQGSSVPDDTLTTADVAVNVTVDPVNDPPVVDTPPGPQVTNEDVDITVDLSGAFDDIDGDALTLSVGAIANAAVDGGATNIVGTDLNIVLLPDANGTGDITVAATDPDLETVSIDISLQVDPQNDDPFVDNPPAAVNATEDDTLITVDFTNVFDDPDVGDTLDLTAAEVGASGLFDSINMAGNMLQLDLAAEQNGSTSIDVTATDDLGATAVFNLAVNVAAVNDQPVVVGAVPALVTNEDQNASISLAGVFDDVDIATNSDSLGYSVQSNSNPAVAVASMAGDSLSVMLVPDQFGTGNVVVRATDGGGLFEEVTVSVTVDTVNDAPSEVGPIPVQSVSEDALPLDIDVSGVFDDVDILTAGDSLALSVAVDPGSDPVIASATVAGSTLSVSFVADSNGTGHLVLTATDDAGETATSDVFINVGAVNDPPFLVSPIVAVTFDEDDPSPTVDIDVFDDIDIATNGDSLSYTVTNVSDPSIISGTSIATTTLSLSFVPDANGSADVTVRATDSFGAWVEDTFTVNVTSINDMPVAADDSYAIDEDSGPLTMDILANDYLAETPTAVTSFDHTTTFTMLDGLGNPITNSSANISWDGSCRYL